jgi:rod shape-determining protein MreC
LITDPGSSVNVHLQNAQADASLVGSVTGDVTLDLIPQDVSLDAGDLVLTSGLGGGYPPDLIVGQVVNVRKRDFDLFQQAAVQPVVDFNRLQIVLIIVNFKPVDFAPLVPAP